MHTCHASLRYFDWDGQVHLVKSTTGGQQGDPLEMLMFNLTIHNLWGRVLKKDAGLDLNISKTSVLPNGVTQQVVFDVAHNIINNPTLTSLYEDVSLASF